MSPFQVRLYQTRAVQVDVPGETFFDSFSGDIREVHYTAGALLKEVSHQFGIPVENLKLAYDHDSNSRYPGSNGRYPGTIITNMNQCVNNDSLYWVVVDKDVLVKKNLKDFGTDLFIEDMTNLLEDPETADFTLKCGSKSFKVHKAILGARSKVFRAMFLSGMKEAVDGEAVITDVEEKTLEEILHYLYTGKLSGQEIAVKSLCYAAKKYELDHLMDLICERIRAAKLEAGELADVFISAEMFYKREMFDIAMEKLK